MQVLNRTRKSDWFALHLTERRLRFPLNTFGGLWLPSSTSFKSYDLSILPICVIVNSSRSSASGIWSKDKSKARKKAKMEWILIRQLAFIFAIRFFLFHMMGRSEGVAQQKKKSIFQTKMIKRRLISIDTYLLLSLSSSVTVCLSFAFAINLLSYLYTLTEIEIAIPWIWSSIYTRLNEQVTYMNESKLSYIPWSMCRL